MKQLNEYISESILADDDELDNRKAIQPKTKDELQHIISKHITELKKSGGLPERGAGGEIDLNWIDTSKITDMSYLFSFFRWTPLIDSWDVSKVEDMSYMFENCWHFKPHTFDNWNFKSVKTMQGMFEESRFNDDVSGWNVENVTNMLKMFNKDWVFKGEGLDTWKTVSLKNCGSMFYDCRALYVNLSNWQSTADYVLTDYMFTKSKMNKKFSWWPKFK